MIHKWDMYGYVFMEYSWDSILNSRSFPMFSCFNPMNLHRYPGVKAIISVSKPGSPFITAYLKKILEADKMVDFWVVFVGSKVETLGEQRLKIVYLSKEV